MVNQSSDVPPMIGARAPGSKVRVKVWREGRTRDITVTLGELDEGPAATPLRSARAPAAQQSNPLGIVGSELGAEQRRRMDLKPDEGVAVARVEGLAARSAGIQPGDVILQVGRVNVATPAELDRELSRARAGETVGVKVQRFATCAHCDGERAEPGSSGKQTCPTCRGAGQVRGQAQSLFGTVITSRPMNSASTTIAPAGLTGDSGSLRASARATPHATSAASTTTTARIGNGPTPITAWGICGGSLARRPPGGIRHSLPRRG